MCWDPEQGLAVVCDPGWGAPHLADSQLCLWPLASPRRPRHGGSPCSPGCRRMKPGDSSEVLRAVSGPARRSHDTFADRSFRVRAVFIHVVVETSIGAMLVARAPVLCVILKPSACPLCSAPRPASFPHTCTPHPVNVLRGPRRGPPLAGPQFPLLTWWSLRWPQPQAL